MKTCTEGTLKGREVSDTLENAVDLLIKNLSYGQALEYCADLDLTGTLERIAERISME